METRPTIFSLLGYDEFYGEEKTLEDAKKLIKGIPSTTLLNYISGFSVNIYLNDKSDNAGKTQINLLNSLASKNKNVEEICKKVLKEWVGKGHSPMIFYVRSNLHFYSLIFSEYNDLSDRDLTTDEAERVFNAYLIVNTEVNKRIKLKGADLKDEDLKKVEAAILSNFIHQRDYQSNIDFSNQVVRGIYFFMYLEESDKYKDKIKDYYRLKGVPGYLRMFKNLAVIFHDIGLNEKDKPRNQLIKIEASYDEGDVDLAFFETLCINRHIVDYKDDDSFSLIRTYPLFKINDYLYYLLDVNFFIDHFYKSQIFAFHSFLKGVGITGEFLSEKAKEFMEEKFIPVIIKRCFPNLIKYFGDDVRNSNGDELCDVYIRNANHIALIEFKDVMLSADAKNSADAEKLFNEFDKKFWENQKGRPKGARQLINAINDIVNNGIKVEEINEKTIELYPILLYTDFVFGTEGLNKYYKEKMQNEVDKLDLKDYTVHNLTFINLNYFEVMQDYLAQKKVDIFTLIKGYHEYTKERDFSSVSFEVYSRHYMNEYVKEDLDGSSLFKEYLPKIIEA